MNTRRNAEIATIMRQYDRDGENLRQWLENAASDADRRALTQNAQVEMGEIDRRQVDDTAIVEAARAAIGRHDSWSRLMKQRALNPLPD